MKSDVPNLEGVIPLFISGFYDVPLDGICKYNGETLFFVVTSDYDPRSNEPVEYYVYRLPREQTEFFMQEKAEFERLVGTRWSYREDEPYRRIGGWSDREDWRTFYDRPQTFVLGKEVNRETAELVGRFTWRSPAT